MNVIPFLDVMDIFVLSTHSEGLPLVILEATAQAKPVIATRVGGIPEIVEHGQTGLLYEHKDSAALAEHILHLLNNRDLSKELAEAGRTAICSQLLDLHKKEKDIDVERLRSLRFSPPRRAGEFKEPKYHSWVNCH